MSEPTCESRKYHNWQVVDGGFACEDCTLTCPACTVCDRATENALVICDRCLQREARVLDDIVTAVGWLIAPRGELEDDRSASRNQRRRGDVLAEAAAPPAKGSYYHWTFEDLLDVIESWRAAWEEARESQ